jgi:hypothetical protein
MNRALTTSRVNPKREDRAKRDNVLNGHPPGESLKFSTLARLAPTPTLCARLTFPAGSSGFSTLARLARPPEPCIHAGCGS